MWQKFLKKKQGSFLVPAYFKNLQVKSKGNQVFSIDLNKPCSSWSWVSVEGRFVRKAFYYEVAKELLKYPSMLCSLVKIEKNNSWIVAANGGILVLRNTPNVELLSLTRVKASVLGTALVFKDFDYRDSSPWLIDDALSLLKKEELSDDIPNYLCQEQRVAYRLLLEKEKTQRVPEAERRVKEIVGREGADLISLKEVRGGYSLSFKYKGTRRNIRIKEDLMLLDSGMCLSGMDKQFSLETFFSILYNRGKRDWRDDGLYT